MAAVAGAIAGMLGEELLPANEELLIENGGDLFSAFNKRERLRFMLVIRPSPGKSGQDPTGSGLGAMYVVRNSWAPLTKEKLMPLLSSHLIPALADAVATACGNRIKAADLAPTIDLATQIAGIKGVVSVIANKMAVWGEIELVKL